MKIKLVLEGAFQAWGVPSEFTTRGTNYIPTKRGVVGLIGCCMGIPRGDRRLESLFSVLSIDVDINREGEIMTDFQTAAKADGSKLNSASGGQAGSYNIILHKSYINDGSFVVHISGPEEVLKKVYDAIMDPVWTPYLGRKNCLPTEPLIPVMEE